MIFADEEEEIYVTETVYHKETGEPRRQWTKLNGLKHAPPNGEASLIAWDDQGRVIQKSWHEFDQAHRIDAPSSIVFYENGVHQTEDFRINGKPLHRNQGPFRIRRHRNGELWHKEFTENDGKEPKFSPPLEQPKPKI